jgi:hypothetical protein
MHFLRAVNLPANSKENSMSLNQTQRSLALADPAKSDSLSIQYLGRLQIAVSGLSTGTLYRFSPLDSVQAVDPQDAFYLLNSGLFGIAQ